MSGNANIVLQDVSSKIIKLRNNKLNELLIQSFNLLYGWETRRDFAENPKEKRRSDIEIKRIKDLIELYEQELKENQEKLDFKN